MRLIDADALKECFKELGWFEPDECDREIKLECILNSAPTAYDMDKVVERLEVNSMFTQEGDEAFVMLDDAVEIVKSGGIE